MDDYSINSLQESRNEWCARLINILTPLVTEGFRSIFDEAWKLCLDNDETEKYLMTYQNFLSRIPKWNVNIVEEEMNRIVDKSNCGYLNDLITCVHIIQLKSLTCMRVGNAQKKVDINIPSLSEFIHKVYINCARKLYTNVYLFEKNITPLQIQKHNRELEIIIRECMLNTIRDNIPVEEILKVYLDESIEEDLDVEEHEEIISTEPIVEENKDSDVKVESVVEESANEPEKKNNINLEVSELDINKALPLLDEVEELEKDMVNETIQFSNTDEAISTEKKIEQIDAPKDIERLEQISNERHEARKLEEMEYDDEEDEKIKIGEMVNLDELDVQTIESPKMVLSEDPLLKNEIEILT
jgi:hypothetical protein